MTGVHQQGWRGAGLLQSKQPGLTTFPGENDHNLRETQPTASHCRPFSSPPLCLSKPAHHWMVTVGSEVSLMFSSWGEWGNSAVHDPAVQQMMHLWSHLLFYWTYEAISLWLQITDLIPGSVAQRAFIFRITLTDSTTCTRATVYGTCKAGFNTFISV